MPATIAQGASGAGLAAPDRATKDEAPELAGTGGFTREQGDADGLDCAARPERTHLSREALRTIEGERRAREYLARLNAERADPDELALVVAMLYGAALRGFCRVIVKALGVRHG